MITPTITPTITPSDSSLHSSAAPPPPSPPPSPPPAAALEGIWELLDVLPQLAYWEARPELRELKPVAELTPEAWLLARPAPAQ